MHIFNVDHGLHVKIDSCASFIADNEEVNSVEVMAILEVSYDKYLRDEEGIRKDLDAALSAAGLKISDVKSSEYSTSQ